jgi:molecular chaperone GrpE
MTSKRRKREGKEVEPMRSRAETAVGPDGAAAEGSTTERAAVEGEEVESADAGSAAAERAERERAGAEPDAVERTESDPAAAVAEREAALQEAADRYLRLRADFENFRRRSRQEILDARGAAVADFLAGMLPVVEDLKRALAAAESGGEKEPLVQGLRLVLRGLEDVLRREGVEELNPGGEVFDERWMEAVGVMPSDRVEPGCVAEVAQLGYRIGQRLIRPARVFVASEVSPRGESNDAESHPADDDGRSPGDGQST